MYNNRISRTRVKTKCSTCKMTLKNIASVKRCAVVDEDVRVKRKSARFEVNELFVLITGDVQNEDENIVQLIPHRKRAMMLENVQICASSVDIEPTIENGKHIEILQETGLGAESEMSNEYDVDKQQSEEVSVRLEITSIPSTVDIVHLPTASESTRLSHIVPVPEIELPNGNEEIEDVDLVALEIDENKVASGKRVEVTAEIQLVEPVNPVNVPYSGNGELISDASQDVVPIEVVDRYWEGPEFQPQLILPKEKVRVSVMAPFVQPIQPAVINVLGMSTRAITSNNYDDTDESQNELIGTEESAGNSSRVALCGRAMPKQRKFELFQEMCIKFKLPPSLPIMEFESIDWDYVSKCCESKLMPNFQFKTIDELKMIPRRHPRFPFCHPGPVRGDILREGKWYYADSIVQKLKFIGRSEVFYNVRWIGYEDEYNTVELEQSLKGSAILILFKRPDIIPASQASGPLLLRRSTRIMNKIGQMNEGDTLMTMTKTVYANECFAEAMAVLDKHLEVEETEGRFISNLGFYSCKDIKTSLNHQLEFIKNVFHPLIKKLKRPQYHLSTKYLGSFFGKLQNKALKKEFDSKALNAPGTVKKLIFEGLKEAQTDEGSDQFVSFFVATKRHGKQKSDDKNLEMHMCVYTVRSHDGQKDSIYFDPAAPCHGRTVPDFLLNLREPVLRSATVINGEESQANDCLYQCFKYIIGLQTSAIAFEANLQSKYFRIKKDA